MFRLSQKQTSQIINYGFTNFFYHFRKTVVVYRCSKSYSKTGDSLRAVLYSSVQMVLVFPLVCQSFACL